MSKLFGTDSAKGVAVAELSCEIAMQAGRAAAAVLPGGNGTRSKILIGKDGRPSSDILEAAVCAGICSAGADSEGLGTIPAPAAAWLTKELGADACIMISSAGSGGNSSGIRLFSPEGRRFPADTEEQIERLVFGIGAGSVLARPSAEMGRMLRAENPQETYRDHLKSLVGTDLSGIKAAIDCAESCAGVTAEELFTMLGAEVLILPEPDDEFTSEIDAAYTRLDRLMDFVTENDCDCGLAFDGDGSGCLAVDEAGKLVDGDALLAIFAKSYNEQDKLRGSNVVASSASSLGFYNFARENGINVLTSGAADRYVLDRMLEEKCSLGGEKSGHIIFLDDLPCGDAQLTGARLLEVMKNTGKKLSELAGEMQRLPQIVLNVRIDFRCKELWKNDPVITDLIKSAAEKLGSAGRITVREVPGPDPFIRIIVEGPDFGEINTMAVGIAQTIKSQCAARK